MAATTHTPLTALETANDARGQIAELRRDIRAGRTTLAQIMADPPPVLANTMCVDVIRLSISTGHRRSTAGMQRLGKLAVRDGINLLMPLGRSSTVTRRWIAEHVTWYRPNPNGGRSSDVRVASGRDAASPAPTPA